MKNAYLKKANPKKANLAQTHTPNSPAPETTQKSRHT
jgi:hypothetical protein